MAYQIGDTVDPNDIVSSAPDSLIGKQISDSDIVPDVPVTQPTSATVPAVSSAKATNYLDILKALVSGTVNNIPGVGGVSQVAKDAATSDTKDPIVAGLVHAGNSAILGQAPNVAGLESALTGQGFTQGKQGEQNYINALSTNNPISSKLGDIAGNTADYMVLPEAALPTKMLMSGGVGAAQGGADALNDNDSTDQVLTKIAEGGLGGAVGEGIAKGLGNAAIKYAPQVVGAQKSIIKTMTPAARQDMAQYLLNAPEGAEQVITPFASSEKMTARNEANLTSGGVNKGAAEARADATGNRFDMMGALDKINESRPEVPNAPIYQGANRAVNNSVDDLLEHAAQLGDTSNGNLSLQNAGKLKTAYGKAIDWTPATPGESLVNDSNKNTYGVIKDYIEKGILPEDLQSYNQANNLYRNASNTKKALGNLQASEQGNNILGLASKIGIASGHPEAVPAAIGLEVASRRIPSAAVLAADRLGNRAPSMGILPQVATSNFDPINAYLNQNQPGSGAQQGDDQNQ